MTSFKFSKVVTLFAAMLMVAGIAAVAQAEQHRAVGSITGQVVNAKHQPVGGAMVRVTWMSERMGGPHRRWHRPQPGQTMWRVVKFGVTVSADDGSFTVNNAPVGRYQIVVMKRGVGFGRLRRPVVVRAGQNITAGTIAIHQGRRRAMRPHH